MQTEIRGRRVSLSPTADGGDPPNPNPKSKNMRIPCSLKLYFDGGCGSNNACASGHIPDEYPQLLASSDVTHAEFTTFINQCNDRLLKSKCYNSCGSHLVLELVFLLWPTVIGSLAYSYLSHRDRVAFGRFVKQLAKDVFRNIESAVFSCEKGSSAYIELTWGVENAA
ncbi:unnamed protein product [Amoebophrya sp. A25]|nr:unnamed protein product [Amoebophrya sp. A25]|eukprot:GSA25T00018718001.1